MLSAENAYLSPLYKAWLVCLLAILVGCGPAKLLQAPAGWPDIWQGRRLYHTPHAYIYASSAVAAGDADRLVQGVARDFRRRTAAEAGKGLLIVTDVKDRPIVNNLEELYALASYAGPAGTKPLSEEEIQERSARIRQATAEAGGDVTQGMRLRCVRLTPSDCGRLLDFPSSATEAVGWGLAIATRKTIEHANRALMQRELEKREIGLFLQVPLTPIILLEERKRVALASVSREIELFGQLIDLQNEWDNERRTNHKQSYRERKINEAMYPVLSTVRELVEEVVETVAEPILQPLLRKDETKSELGNLDSGE